jgi:hypothetical protein
VGVGCAVVGSVDGDGDREEQGVGEDVHQQPGQDGCGVFTQPGQGDAQQQRDWDEYRVAPTAPTGVPIRLPAAVRRAGCEGV